MAIGHSDCSSSMPTTSPALAPSAIRMPNSVVRCPTTHDITP